MKKISGVGKRHIFNNFFKRINTPYDLRVQNAIDGEEIIHLGLTKKSVYILISSFLVFSFLLVSLLFLFTPIKYYIPGYETNASRKKIIELQTKLEELESYQQNYNKLIRNVGGVVMDDEAMLLDTSSLSAGQLSSAEMSNELQIGSAAGKRRVIGKRPVDTSKAARRAIKNLQSSSTIQNVAEAGTMKPAAKPVKKRDTIITYK